MVKIGQKKIWKIMGQAKSNNKATCETCKTIGPSRGKDAVSIGWGTQSINYQSKNKPPKWFCPSCYVDYLEKEKKDKIKQMQNLQKQIKPFLPFLFPPRPY